MDKVFLDHLHFFFNNIVPVIVSVLAMMMMNIIHHLFKLIHM